MARRHTPDQVIAKVRQGQKMLNEGHRLIEVIKELQITEATWYRWLNQHGRQPRKQRHTAKRVFDRLVEEENYLGTYSPVQRFVRRYKQERQSDNDGFLELDWAV